VADWVAAENRVSLAYLAKVPLRQHFQRRITELWNYPKVSQPLREGGRYFYQKNSGLQRQSPIYWRASLTATPKLLLDPNTISPDGSVSVSQWMPSPDGLLLAYGLAEGGADWMTLHAREVASGQDLAHEARWVRFSNISWTNDGKGFFYSRLPGTDQGQNADRGFIRPGGLLPLDRHSAVARSFDL
jgi:prolyl oligopeptidase